MKKAVAYFLTGTMVLSLTACLPNVNVSLGDKDTNNGVRISPANRIPLIIQKKSIPILLLNTKDILSGVRMIISWTGIISRIPKERA